jgi:excinuclease ABC subunit A
VLNRLVRKGNTVVVIEHNLDIIKVADHLVDMGPEGGAGGGEVIAVGTPEQIAAAKRSFTGHYLKPILERGVRADDRDEDEEEPVEGFEEPEESEEDAEGAEMEVA